MPPLSNRQSDKMLNIAVVGSGISALSAAWLLSQRHSVTLYEKADRLGGHSNTITASLATGKVAVDTGFICYNDATYPNLIALFDHLDVPSCETDMSFAVSNMRHRAFSLRNAISCSRNFGRCCSRLFVSIARPRAILGPWPGPTFPLASIC